MLVVFSNQVRWWFFQTKGATTESLEFETVKTVKNCKFGLLPLGGAMYLA